MHAGYFKLLKENLQQVTVMDQRGNPRHSYYTCGHLKTSPSLAMTRSPLWTHRLAAEGLSASFSAESGHSNW
jgi:hypothetical protein